MGRHPRSIGRVQEDSSLMYSVYRAHAGDAWDFDYALAADVLYDEDVSSAAGLFRYALVLLNTDDGTGIRLTAQ